MAARTLQQILDDSLATAGPAVQATFAPETRRLTATELREFWQTTRMFAVSTVGKNGAPHIAPVHVTMSNDEELQMAIFTDSVRLRDLRRDPRMAITTWSEEGRIAIVYGRAYEVEGTRRPINPNATNPDFARQILTMKIEIDRAYAMRPVRQPSE